VGFAQGAFGSGFTQLHEAGRQCPFAFSGLDIALAQQNLLTRIAPVGHGADDVEWIFVMNGPAGWAHGTDFGVAVIGHPMVNGGAASPAMVNL
jgi:hypothetical protein